MISDGFSCRYQMKHGAERWANASGRGDPDGPPDRRQSPEAIPEERYLEPPPEPEIGLALAATGVLAGLAVAAWAGTRVGRKASA